MAGYKIAFLFFYASHASAQNTLLSDVPQYLDLTNPEHDYIFPYNSYDWEELEPYISSDEVLAHHWGVTDEYRRALNTKLDEFKAKVSNYIIIFYAENKLLSPVYDI